MKIFKNRQIKIDPYLKNFLTYHPTLNLAIDRSQRALQLCRGDLGLIIGSCLQIPGITLTTTEKALDYKSRGKQKLYDDITLSFYCTENMNELRFFNRWMNTIINPISNRVEYYDNYTASVKITTLSKDPNINTNYISNAKTNNKELLVVTLHEAFPKRIEPIQMDYTAGSEVMKLNITMTLLNKIKNIKNQII